MDSGSQFSASVSKSRVSASRGPEDEVERNPFTLPSDEEVFRMRDTERRQRIENREKQAQMKVWQKTTATALSGRSAKVAELLDGAGAADMGGAEAAPSKKSQKTRALVSAAKTVLGGDRRPEKENMAEFIAKKREMFLVQMSLDTKREEIRKLEEKAQMKEEALKKSEQMLEEDAIRFDTFLKENDKKAHDAIKSAEKETKLKQDKVQEIKKLNQNIQMVQSDMSKHKEALEDCLKYREFLDGLTPQEFFDSERDKKRARQEGRRQGRISAKLAAWEERCKAVQADHSQKMVEQHEELLAKGMSKKKAAATIKAIRPPRDPPRCVKLYRYSNLFRLFVYWFVQLLVCFGLLLCCCCCCCCCCC
jgi:DNA repair exonuclease SbcCD ATPase subunit